MRKPDEVLWTDPRKAFCLGVGWVYQHYGFKAWGLVLWVGPLTLKWHTR